MAKIENLLIPIARVGRAHGDTSNKDSLSERLVRLPLRLGLQADQVDVIQRVIASVH